MPTAAKLTAALFFAALAWLCADLIRPLLPEGTQVGYLNYTLAAVGAICGWLMSGARAGDGTRSGFGLGLTSAALLVFWGTFIVAGNEMLALSMSGRFGGPMVALQAMVGIMIGYFKLIAVPQIVLALVVGGLFGGWLTEWADDRWP